MVKLEMESMAHINYRFAKRRWKLTVLGQLRLEQKELLMSVGHNLKYNYSIIGRQIKEISHSRTPFVTTLPQLSVIKWWWADANYIANLFLMSWCQLFCNLFLVSTHLSAQSLYHLARQSALTSTSLPSMLLSLIRFKLYFTSPDFGFREGGLSFNTFALLPWFTFSLPRPKRLFSENHMVPTIVHTTRLSSATYINGFKLK